MRVIWVIACCFETFSGILNHFASFREIGGNSGSVGPFCVTLSHFRASEVFWGHWGQFAPFKSIPVVLQVFWAISVELETCGVILWHFGSFWAIFGQCNHFGSFGSDWDILGPFGRFSGHLGLSRPFGGDDGYFGSFWFV